MSTGSEIDEEIANFRDVQEQLQRVRNDLQLVMTQLTENESKIRIILFVELSAFSWSLSTFCSPYLILVVVVVNQELAILDSSTNVYKMVGPVLIKNSLDDANETVSKRIEFITVEKKRLEKKSKELETRGNAIATKVQQMQNQLQQATVAAVEQIKQQAATSS